MNEMPLAWLADAPMFIDAEQVAAFYDAVVMPESDTEKITISTSDIKISKSGLYGGLKAEASISTIIKTLFPFLDAKVSAEVSAAKEKTRQHETAEVIELRPIHTPQRQLVQLALHYVSSLPERFLYLQLPNIGSELTGEFISGSPRAVLFLDLVPGTPIIPVAAELAEGRVVLFYEELAKELSDKTRTQPPKYPAELAQSSPADSREYWSWYSANFSDIRAMNVLERSIGAGGRPRWVDYRFPIADGSSLHLHVCGRELYDTGVHAYSFIRRGWKHGLRLVGTLKSGPDMNVLAVFDR